MTEFLDALMGTGYAASIQGTPTQSVIAIIFVVMIFKLLFWMCSSIGTLLDRR